MIQIQKKGFGKRLKSERERLNLSVSDFASLGAVNRVTQTRYESEVYFPTVEYLHEIGKHGVDMLYLTTGERNAPLDPLRDPAGFMQAVSLVEEIAKQHKFEMPPEFQVRAVLRTYEQILKFGPKKVKPTIQQLVADAVDPK